MQVIFHNDSSITIKSEFFKGQPVCVLSSSYFLTRFCIMVINACEICTCCSACFRNSSICSSCCLALDSCSFFCNSYSCVRMPKSSLSAFSFRNSTASTPLLRVFSRHLPQIHLIFFWGHAFHRFFLTSSAASLSSDVFNFFRGKAIFLLT